MNDQGNAASATVMVLLLPIGLRWLLPRDNGGAGRIIARGQAYNDGVLIGYGMCGGDMSLPAGPTPLIGRGRELAALLARLAAAGGGAGGTVVLAGEAGMGKSRLVAEVLADASRRQFTYLRGSC